MLVFVVCARAALYPYTQTSNTTQSQNGESKRSQLSCRGGIVNPGKSDVAALRCLRRSFDRSASLRLCQGLGHAVEMTTGIDAISLPEKLKP